MNRNEYLIALARELRKLPKQEFDQAMDYYTEYFEDAGPENEQEVIKELGSPVEVAKQIIMDAAIKRMEDPSKTAKKGFSSIWLVILGICAAPMALPLVLMVLLLMAGLLIVVAGLILAAIAVDLSAFIGGVVAIVVGIIGLFQTAAANALALLGVGMLLLGAGIFLGFLIIIMGKWMFKGVRALFRRILKRGKRA